MYHSPRQASGRSHDLIVRFEKQSDRRYSTTILRDDGIRLRMDPSPGFDEFLPHDLQHFIVEKALGLKNGVFGQVALGGTAGTFHSHGPGGSKRERSRRHRAAKRKGQGLLRSGRDDSARSERATIVCLHYWRSRSADPAIRREAHKVADFAQATLNGMEGDERDCYTAELLEAVQAEMDRLSAQWRNCGSVEVTW
jgi:hypothetical protein